MEVEVAKCKFKALAFSPEVVASYRELDGALPMVTFRSVTHLMSQNQNSPNQN